jgi:hypothetical protein
MPAEPAHSWANRDHLPVLDVAAALGAGSLAVATRRDPERIPGCRVPARQNLETEPQRMPPPAFGRDRLRRSFGDGRGGTSARRHADDAPAREELRRRPVRRSAGPPGPKAATSGAQRATGRHRHQATGPPSPRRRPGPARATGPPSARQGVPRTGTANGRRPHRHGKGPNPEFGGRSRRDWGPYPCCPVPLRRDVLVGGAPPAVTRRIAHKLIKGIFRAHFSACPPHRRATSDKNGVVSVPVQGHASCPEPCSAQIR